MLAHDVGQFGIKKIEELLYRDYSITGLKTKIKKVVHNCIHFNESKQGKHEVVLKSIDKGETTICTFHIDFLGLLTLTAKNYNYIFSVIDAFSKFC